jgi:hypothetical protein
VCPLHLPLAPKPLEFSMFGARYNLNVWRDMPKSAG